MAQAPGHTLRRTPTAPPSVSQCHLDITLVPQAPLSPTPQGSRRSCCPCQGCFLLLCSKSSATACSSKDFLLSGPPSSLAQPGTHSPSPELASRSPGSLCPLILAGPMGFPPSSRPVSAHCPTLRAPRPGFPRRGTCGQLGRSRLHCLPSLGQDLSWSRGSARSCWEPEEGDRQWTGEDKGLGGWSWKPEEAS